MKHVSLNDLSYATFAGLLNTTFRVRKTGTEALELELIEATANQSDLATVHSGKFVLVFMGPLDQFLPQRIYPFEHEKLGAFDLFIVPLGKDPKGFRYEAIFNRAA